MKTEHVSQRNRSSEVRSITCTGLGEPIIICLTPLSERDYRLFMRGERAQQRRLTKESKQQERNERRQDARCREAIRRTERQKARLICLLKKNKTPGGCKHKCAACRKTANCVKYRDRFFCLNCIQLGKDGEIEVICPHHKTWSGGKYGTCPGCLGLWG